MTAFSISLLIGQLKGKVRRLSNNEKQL